MGSAPGAIRTPDPLLRKQVLYPLSYEGSIIENARGILPYVFYFERLFLAASGMYRYRQQALLSDQRGKCTLESPYNTGSVFVFAPLEDPMHWVNPALAFIVLS
jgi:hypothetical protein